MTEATESLRLAKLRASMGTATNVLARQRALAAAKDQLRRQGLRPSQFTAGELRLQAEAYLAEHCAKLIEDARADVECWRREGFFGRRAMACCPVALSQAKAQTKCLDLIEVCA